MELINATQYFMTGEWVQQLSQEFFIVTEWTRWRGNTNLSSANTLTMRVQISEYLDRYDRVILILSSIRSEEFTDILLTTPRLTIINLYAGIGSIVHAGGVDHDLRPEIISTEGVSIDHMIYLIDHGIGNIIRIPFREVPYTIFDQVPQDSIIDCKSLGLVWSTATIICWASLLNDVVLATQAMAEHNKAYDIYAWVDYQHEFGDSLIRSIRANQAVIAIVDSFDTDYVESLLLQQLKAYGLYGIHATVMWPRSANLTMLMSEYLSEQAGLDPMWLANRLL